jgi:AraC-like DNA-binding protein
VLRTAVLDYRETSAPRALDGILSCVWTMRGPGGGGIERVLSDGSVEIVFNFGDPFRRHLPCGAQERQPARLLVGPLSGHIQIEPTGAIDVLGIRLRPGAAAALVRVPLAELQDRDLELEAVDATLPGSLHERLGNASSEERVPLVLEAIGRAQRPSRVAAAVTAVCRALADSPQSFTVDAAAARTGLSRRTVERLFLRDVGLTPKRLQRISRVQAVLRRVHGGATFAAAALDAGYYDQPHFLRDFRELAGTTPSEYLGPAATPMAEAFTAGA